MPDKVSAEDILALANVGPGEKSVSVKPLTALQRAGVRFTAGVGIAGVVIIAIVLIFWLVKAPAQPSLPTDITGLTEEHVKTFDALLVSYRTAGEISLEGPSKLIDQLIVKIIYPLFTLLLGYVFGTAGKKPESS